MSKKLAFVDLSDKYRPLLTDVLPYETTLIFSNDGFHSLIEDLSSNKQVFEKLNSIIDKIKNKNNNKNNNKKNIKRDIREISALNKNHNAYKAIKEKLRGGNI